MIQVCYFWNSRTQVEESQKQLKLNVQYLTCIILV